MSSQEPALPTAPAVPAAVEADGVCRRYGRRWALVDVSLALPRGSALVVAGRNGAGKSTLFRVLSTLLRPDHGSVRILGLDPREDLLAARRRVALLSHASNHHEALTALENLEVAARFLGRSARREALLPRLAEVGLAERADDPVLAFSAGMRKRLTLARTLLQEAEVVLLDEPYGQLDPPGARLVDELVARLRARGATVLMATHQLERGAALCERGLVLEAGRVVWTGPAREVAAASRLEPSDLQEGGA